MARSLPVNSLKSGRTRSRRTRRSQFRDARKRRVLGALERGNVQQSLKLGQSEDAAKGDEGLGEFESVKGIGILCEGFMTTDERLSLKRSHAVAGEEDRDAAMVLDLFHGAAIGTRIKCRTRSVAQIGTGDKTDAAQVIADLAQYFGALFPGKEIGVACVHVDGGNHPQADNFFQLGKIGRPLNP